MFTIIPNYDYESQNMECKNMLSKHDFKAVCDLIHIKERIKKNRMTCPDCGQRLIIRIDNKGRSVGKCVNCQKGDLA